MKTQTNAKKKPPRDTDPMRNFSMHNPLIVKAPLGAKSDPPWWGGRPMDVDEAKRRYERSAEATLARARQDQGDGADAAAAMRRSDCGHTFSWPEDGAGNRIQRPPKLRGRRLHHHLRLRGDARRRRAGG